VSEWKAKVDDLNAELEASQKECRSYNSELFRLRAAWDETVEQLDVVKRENKNLADEIKDLLDQLGDGGRLVLQAMMKKGNMKKLFWQIYP
jgi:septal ring factor EnvC (AmiA/AmiB activator)